MAGREDTHGSYASMLDEANREIRALKGDVANLIKIVQTLLREVEGFRGVVADTHLDWRPCRPPSYPVGFEPSRPSGFRQDDGPSRVVNPPRFGSTHSTGFTPRRSPGFGADRPSTFRGALGVGDVREANRQPGRISDFDFGG